MSKNSDNFSKIFGEGAPMIARVIIIVSLMIMIGSSIYSSVKSKNNPNVPKPSFKNLLAVWGTIAVLILLAFKYDLISYPVAMILVFFSVYIIAGLTGHLGAGM